MFYSRNGDIRHCERVRFGECVRSERIEGAEIMARIKGSKAVAPISLLASFGDCLGHDSFIESGVTMSTDDLQETLAEHEVESRKLAKAVEADNRMQVVADLAGLGMQSSIHNLTGDAVQVWRMISLGENKSTPGNDLVGKAGFGIVNWYLHRIRLVDDKTGEIFEPVRTVLYTDDGRILHFVSDGIVKSVAKLIQTFGIGPYAPPIRVEVLEIRTNSGFKMMTLIPAE